MDKYGVAGQDVFDMLGKGASASEVEKTLYSYLPNRFGFPGDGICTEQSHSNGKSMDIEAHSGSLERVRLPEGVSIPEWADRINLRIWFKIRYKPQTESSAKMLCTAQVSISVESVTIPLRNEVLFEHQHRDIDDALDEVFAILYG